VDEVLGRCVHSDSDLFWFSRKSYLFRVYPIELLLHYSYICGNIIPEVKLMKFVGVREFKQDVVKYLNEGNEIVVMKRKKPIARLTPVQKKSAEIILLEIGRVLSEAGVSKKEALKALDRARREIYG